MNAFEYGLGNFENKYQPKPNIVVFNDEITFVDDYETNEEEQNIVPIDIPDTYIYAKAYPFGDNKYKLYNPITAESSNYVEQYLIPNGYFTDLGNDNQVVNAEGTYQVYEYDNSYYVKYLNPIYDLDEVVIEAKNTNLKIIAFTDEKFKELIANPDLKLIFFFSSQGQKLINAYDTINQIKPNEVIFFIEKDDSYNVSSVSFVLSGSNINSSSKLPIMAIAHLANHFNVGADVLDIAAKTRKIFDKHLDAKASQNDKGILYYLGKAAKAPLVINNYILYGIGVALEVIGDGISNDLTFDEKRWKYYDDNGEKSKVFSPILPGFESLLNHLEKQDEKSKAFNTTDSLEVVLQALDVKMDLFFNSPTENEFKQFFKDKFGFISTIINKIKTLYISFKEIFTLKNTLIYGNALLIGIVNSLIKAIGGIISLAGNILQAPYNLSKKDPDRERLAKESTSLISAMELFEELGETCIKLFSVKNLKALFNGFVDMAKEAYTTFSNPNAIISTSKAFTLAAANKANEAVEYLSTRVDSIGYGMGFVIGFIVEEVITGILTGGAKTIASALKLSADSFVQLFKLGKSAIKGVAKSPVSLVEGLIALFRYLRKLDIKKVIENFIEWFKKLFTTAKQLAEEVFNKLFNPRNQKRINDAGFVPTRVNGDMVILCPIKI
jgi:hypothetical protein